MGSKAWQERKTLFTHAITSQVPLLASTNNSKFTCFSCLVFVFSARCLFIAYHNFLIQYLQFCVTIDICGRNLHISCDAPFQILSLEIQPLPQGLSLPRRIVIKLVEQDISSTKRSGAGIEALSSPNYNLQKHKYHCKCNSSFTQKRKHSIELQLNRKKNNCIL